ncbi:UDP-N-acetylmuramoyl-L-alanine--D-glutamate ligase [Candidatus Saccharibacteria bacterium]|nr:UDP-N-acetylmuramoyl-L-alanine--D-glutamate ligase [Candidatus Saccharibacteria bacterium]
MKIALLGYGKEGKSAEKYCQNHFKDAEFDIFENFNPQEINQRNYSSYDIIFRSPSVPPLGLPQESSVTKYFFEKCPCPIIGVTGTKGKGTTCSFIKALLDAENQDAYLVGNIGNPALDELDELKPSSVVVYELSSFQLWDLEKSPHIAVIGHLEPDHLNVHKDYQDYLNAKSHVCCYQSENDYCIFYQNNPESVKLADSSPAQKIAFPFALPDDIKSAISLPGEHNFNNFTAAVAAVASYKNISPDAYLSESKNEIIKGLKNFKGLPHRLEFLRELNGIKYYDDNFSTNPSSTRVAVKAFPDDNLVIIVGGRDKTNNEDLPEIHEILQSPNIKKIVLLGESGHELAKRYQDNRFTIVESLEEAINTAKTLAESLNTSDKNTIVLMSPSAASFDMFKNVYDRGDQFKNLISSLTAK